MDDEVGVRLNKFISEAGITSRRGADKLIAERRVTLDGNIAVLGDKVLPEMEVCVDNVPIFKEKENIILAVYKPVGVTCTANPEDKDNIIDFIQYPKRIFYIGRLDKDSEGLLLMTNNGDLANKIMRSRYEHEKEYIVSVDKDIVKDFIDKMSNGVRLEEGTVTKKCFVESIGPKDFRIILKQGLNRQIRRMCDVFGYTVVNLKRVRVMNINLTGIREGQYRNLTKKEKEDLYLEIGKE